jgi:O-antigen/teichoic acid export membrane protein
MSDNSKIVKNSLILYVRLLVVSVVGLLSSRYILQVLGVSDFGLYNVIGGIVFMMAFLNNIMVSTTFRFIAFEMGTGNNKKVNNVFNVSLVIHLFVALLVILFSETIGVYYIKNFLNIPACKLSDTLFVFHFSIFSILFSVISVPFQGLIIAKENFRTSALIEVLRSFLALGIVVFLLFYSGNRLRLYAFLIAVASVIPPVIYFFYSKKYYPLLIKWNFQRSKNKYRKMVSFSGWILFGASASAAENQGSVLLINVFFGTLLNAGFSIANQVNNLVVMFSSSINQAFIPQITKSYSGGNQARTNQLMVFSSKYSFLLMLVPALPILLSTDYLLKLWLKEVPPSTTIFIRLMIINSLIAAANAGIPAVVQATEKIKYFQIILSVITLSGLPVSYILFKLEYPPYVLLITYTAIAIINFFVSQVLLKRIIDFDVIEFFKKVYLRILFVIISIIPFFLIRPFFKSDFIGFMEISLFSVLGLIISIYFLGMNQSEKKLTKSIPALVFKEFSKW